MTPTMVVAVHDGFYGNGTGAGRCNRALLDVLAGCLAPGVRLVVLPVHLNPGSPEYDAGWHAGTRTIVERASGIVRPVGNGTGGRRRFAGLPGFRHACASAARAIHALIGDGAGPLLVVTSDVPFYGLAPLLPVPVRRSVVAVAHATAVLHDPGDAERVDWERDGLRDLVAHGGRVAAISRHMREHLAVEYRIPDRSIVDLVNGLTRQEWRIAAPDARLLPDAAAGGFLLALGRAVPYKGWDDLLDALKLAGPVPHTLLAAVTDGPEVTPYQEHLARRIAGEGLDVTLVTRFDPAVASLMAHPALAALVVPSRAEPFGRIPMEAFAAGTAPVVATGAGGLAELVINGVTGYSAEAGDAASLAQAIGRALATDPEGRARLREAGRQLVASRYSYERNVHTFLQEVAPWAVAPWDAT
ncbi:glycosyltransferase family 4 protein [Planomonospora sp. ID82291]|uniref:glycosyltransferase family 4 protein n=1 Tax=Planomonospora sp. ID82291 TaxID=2738136 RepID=UPI0018C4378E|nr:glycosyltransferase family 4 protein [Planomonospora sp. ID82291]MBG0818458.1 glycosyltransferase family 4 protein [Planomonospora sp. ID82291]